MLAESLVPVLPAFPGAGPTVMAGSEIPSYLPPTAALVLAASLVGYLSVRAGVVPIVGFLLAGVLIGPSQIGLVSSTEAVEAAADVGVILLLFTIGIEFSLERLARVWRWIVLGGGGQVLLAIGVTMGLVAVAGKDWRIGLFTGFLVALSSTAIVLTILSDSRQTGTTRGRLALSVLIFQDLAVVAMVVVVPLLSVDAEGGGASLARALGIAVAMVAGVLVVARAVMPKVLERVAALCSPEVFLLTVIAICFGTAYLTALAGVSVSLGAFLAGLVVSESRQSTQAMSEVLPLQIVFSAVFFVSVGMLLDVGFLLDNILLVVALAVGVLVLKVATTTLALLPTGVGWRHAVAAGLLLGQVGEFSFVLMNVGEEAGLSPAGLGEDGSQALVATTVMLMVLTPVLAISGDRVLRGGRRDSDSGAVAEPTGDHGTPDADHVVILGWGTDSLILARELQGRDVDVVMTTLNPDGAALAEAAGVPVVTGDSTRGAVLEHAGVARARMVVIAEDDAEQAAKIATLVKGQTRAPVLVRPPGAAELMQFAEAGVEHVVDPGAASRLRLFQAVLDGLSMQKLPLPLLHPDRSWADTTALTHRPVPADLGCAHGAASVPVLPASAGCLDCMREGASWIHLRLCLQCGNVGCCDSSPGRHARAHHHDTGHPLITSLEVGETWGYCFVDDVTWD